MSFATSFVDGVLRYFPPPRYLTLAAVGLDVSDESIKLIELGVATDHLTLLKHGEEKIPLGVVENGKIKDAGALVRSLESVRKKHAVTNIIVSLPEEQAYVVKLRLPPIKRSELRGGIELQLEEFVPLKPSEAEFDYDIMHEPDRVHPYYDLNVSVLPKVTVQSYTDVFTRAGLRPVIFEIEGQALARAVVPESDQGTVMVVDFGKWRTGIAIVQERTLRFSATLPFGGSHVNKAIMEKFQVSEDEAERMKRDQKSVPAAQQQALQELVTASLAVLADEISKYKLFWQEHKDEVGEERKKIAEVVLCGGASNVPGISETLHEAVLLPVRLANPWVNVLALEHDIPAIPAKDALRYATAIGLALRAVPHLHDFRRVTPVEHQ